MPKTTGLKIFKPKKIGLHSIRKAFRDLNNKSKPTAKLVLRDWHKRTVFAISPAMTATAREFKTKEDAVKYTKNQRKVEKTITESNPKTFKLQPVQFLGRKEKILLERVYHGPSFIEFYFKRGRYYKNIKRRLKEKGIDLNKEENFIRVSRSIEKTEKELQKILMKTDLLYSSKPEILIDFKSDNFLFLDFNPKTNKVLLAFIDFDKLGSIRTWGK